MVETEAGFFVVKWRENPQHRRILINEALCSELLKSIGIATPAWARIHVDARFLAEFPEARIELRRGTDEILPGWHFGSNVPVSPGFGAVYDFLPRGVINRVRNRSDFLKVLIFDLWTDNCDGRQAIFHRIANYGFRAEMIDHGHCLGFDGVTWRPGHSAAGRSYRGLGRLYLAPQAERHYERCIRLINRITIADLKHALEKIPAEWICGDDVLVQRLFDKLVDREDRLSEMLTSTLCYIRSKLTADSHEHSGRNFLHPGRALPPEKQMEPPVAIELPSRYVLPGWSFLSSRK